MCVELAGCGKTISAQKRFDDPRVRDKPGLSGYLVCLVHLVSLMQPNKPDRPNRPNEHDRLADFFSILPGLNGVYGRFTEEWRESGIQSGPGRIAPAPWCAGSFNRGREREYLIWCRRRDLNPHGLRHTPLKRACLPFHHFGTWQELENPPQLRSRIAQTLNVLSSTPRAFACCGLVAGIFEAPATRDTGANCHVVSCPRFMLHERRATV